MIFLGTVLQHPSVQQAPTCCSGSMSAFLSDPTFMAAHERPLPFKFKSAEGENVSFKGPVGTHHGYFVSGSKAAIIMVHEWWGLNDYIKQEAVKLHHRTGYAVLAVDLYNGQVAQDADQAGKLMGAVDASSATQTVRDAADDLYRGDLGKPYHRLGSIGWCFGGGYSLQTAIQGGSKVRACVMYYGMPDDSAGDLAKLKAPVLMVEALQDKWISPEVVSKFKTAMSKAGKPLQVVTYDADHAFANPSNPHFKKNDAQDAMSRSLAFFKNHLG